MNRYLMTGLLGFLGLAYAAQVQPTTAPPGTSLRLTLTNGIQIDDPKLFIGAHKLDATKVPNSDGKQWDFEMPEGILPGTQPIQLRSDSGERTRLLSWVTVLRESREEKNSIVIIPRENLNNRALLDKIAAAGRNLTNVGNEKFPIIIKDIVNKEIEIPNIKLQPIKNDTQGKISIPADVLDFIINRDITPAQKIEEIQSSKLEALKITKPEELYAFQDMLEKAVYGQQIQKLKINGYDAKIFPDPIGAASGKYSVSIGYFKSAVPILTTSPVSAEPNICQRLPYRIDFTSKNASIIKALYLNQLSKDDDIWIDPTGYGIPSQVDSMQQQSQLATQVRNTILQANVRQLNATGLYRNGRTVYPQGGKGVTIFVIDSDGSAITSAGKEGLELHGPAITRIIKTLAPAATIVERPACRGGMCQIEKIVSALCEAAQVARDSNNRTVIVNLSLNAPYQSEMLAAAIDQVIKYNGIIVAAHGNNDRCKKQKLEVGASGADYCYAYPADWAGSPIQGVVQPPIPRAINPSRWKGKIFSVGAWDISNNSPADYNRGVNPVGKATVAPTTPISYTPGTFVFDFTAFNRKKFAGTSFASPTLVAMLATQVSENGNVPDLSAQKPSQARISTYEMLTR